MAQNVSGAATQYQIRPVQVAALLLALVGIYFLLPQVGELHATLMVLRGAQWGWVLLGLAASAATFWTTAYTQYAAGSSLGNIRELVKLAFAGSFMNHFLPYSVGTISLTADYYHKLHQRRPQAIILASIPTIVGAVLAALILAVASPLTLLQLNRSFNFGAHTRLIYGLLLGCLALALLAAFFYWRNLVDFVREAVKGFNTLRSPRQAAKVLAGALVTTVIAALALYCSIEAVHAHIPLAVVITLYITATLVGEVTPTPGGLGAIEAVLVFGSSAAGLSLDKAFVVTLIFRFITFWLPLIPGAYALVGLRRLKTHL